MHTVFSTQCNPYFDWQSIVLTYSFIRAGQPGKLTRLMSCSDDDYARLLRERPRVLDIVDTFVVEDVESDTELQ